MLKGYNFCMNEYSVKSIKKDFKKHGVFYTPKHLAKYLLDFVDISYSNVYDPTCGRGNLLSIIDDSVLKYGQELNAQELDVAKQNLKNFEGIQGDTLEKPAFLNKQFDFIFANPPYSISWNPAGKEKDIRFKNAPCIPPPSKADYAFILHILHFLKDTGIAIVLCFPGVCYRGGREGKIRKWLIENNYIDSVIHVDGKKFTDTNISTVAFVFKKNKTDKAITFINDSIGKRKQIQLDDIRRNDYNLTPSNYVYEEIKKEHIDPIKLENEAQKEVIERIEKEIRFSIMVSEIEGFDPLPFIKNIENLLLKLKNEIKKDGE